MHEHTLTIEGWCKASGASKSTRIGDISFNIYEDTHTRLEQAEIHLQAAQEREIMIDVDLLKLELKLPAGYGPLSDCQFRVYLNKEPGDSIADKRGQFHLVGHQSDGCLIYTNAVLIDQLIS
ncbi:MAG: hypothetical protein JWP80_4190 [Pseudomonas sp.]|nr:hypothetical protein [Pseudomonas sp.]